MPDIVLIGASVRALAESARRCDLDPLCVDLFRDADLVAHHPAAILCPLDQYPAGFASILGTVRRMPVMYTGGLENYPDVIETISKRHRLRGVSAATLRQLRDPYVLFDAMRRNGCRVPAVARCLVGAPPGRWLKKKIAGSAGRGVQDAAPGEVADGRHYFQEFVPGDPYSAAYVSDGACHLIGVSEQLIGCDWLNARPFWYCGNVGPVAPSRGLTGEAKAFGEVVVREFGVRGLFGIDMMIRGTEASLIEVNPRYTASMEVYERHFSGWPLVNLHLRSLRENLRPFQPPEKGGCVGKAIWHTPHPCRAMYHPENLPPDVYADLPHHGQAFGANEPFVTLFAKGLNRDAVVEKLKVLAAGVPTRFKVEAT